MKFFEYETWELAADATEAAHSDMIKAWFNYVKSNKDKLFSEWVSARHFVMSTQGGEAKSKYAMIFEYNNCEGHHAYKARKQESLESDDGVYSEYNNLDPYKLFNTDTVGIEYMVPAAKESWINYSSEGEGFYKLILWNVSEGNTKKQEEVEIISWLEAMKPLCGSEMQAISLYSFCGKDGEEAPGFGLLLKFSSPEAMATHAKNLSYPKLYVKNATTTFLKPLQTDEWFDYDPSPVLEVKAPAAKPIEEPKAEEVPAEAAPEEVVEAAAEESGEVAEAVAEVTEEAAKEEEAATEEAKPEPKKGGRNRR